MRKPDNEFEITVSKTTYFGTYHFDGNRLIVDSVYFQNEDEQEEVPSQAMQQRIWEALDLDKADERNEYVEALDYAAQEEKWEANNGK